MEQKPTKFSDLISNYIINFKTLYEQMIANSISITEVRALYDKLSELNDLTGKIADNPGLEKFLFCADARLWPLKMEIINSFGEFAVEAGDASVLSKLTGELKQKSHEKLENLYLIELKDVLLNTQICESIPFIYNLLQI